MKQVKDNYSKAYLVVAVLSLDMTLMVGVT